MAYAGREGWAFPARSSRSRFAVAGLFVALFPDVMPSSTDAAYSLTTTNAAATAYTLKMMTWVAAIFTPLVLGYQAWTYWVFRKRISACTTSPTARAGVASDGRSTARELAPHLRRPAAPLVAGVGAAGGRRAGC